MMFKQTETKTTTTVQTVDSALIRELFQSENSLAELQALSAEADEMSVPDNAAALRDRIQATAVYAFRDAMENRVRLDIVRQTGIGEERLKNILSEKRKISLKEIALLAAALDLKVSFSIGPRAVGEVVK